MERENPRESLSKSKPGKLEVFGKSCEFVTLPVGLVIRLVDYRVVRNYDYIGEGIPGVKRFFFKKGSLPTTS